MIIATTIVSLIFGLLSLSEALSKANSFSVRTMFSIASFAFVVLAAFLAGGFYV